MTHRAYSCITGGRAPIYLSRDHVALDSKTIEAGNGQSFVAIVLPFQLTLPSTNVLLRRLRYGGVHVFRPWLLVEAVHIDVPFRRHLVRFSPLPYALVITAPMLRIEVDERCWVRVAFWLPPYLPEHSNIRLTHQHLSQHIQAVSRVDPHDVFGVDERTFAFRQVVIVVPMEGLSKEILIMSSIIYHQIPPTLTRQCI
jgi:hypothetical protein